MTPVHGEEVAAVDSPAERHPMSTPQMRFLCRKSSRKSQSSSPNPTRSPAFHASFPQVMVFAEASMSQTSTKSKPKLYAYAYVNLIGMNSFCKTRWSGNQNQLVTSGKSSPIEDDRADAEECDFRQAAAAAGHLIHLTRTIRSRTSFSCGVAREDGSSEVADGSRETIYERLTQRGNTVYTEAVFQSFSCDLLHYLKAFPERCREIWVKFGTQLISQGLLTKEDKRLFMKNHCKQKKLLQS
ncbi:conserved hypothetical protein [Culex quinquefasciatus]|uniref:Uncharacterized protein n=1 Tax=Culex quinquefasciatus TaxID=7176 RepID=B0X5B0_CULQU|nr:conserved hypothetical protein [Culex quinquefasciatus]|eukprot:XP_001864832.1 conserved hypothetical protein [Culex quinquefasciatus]